MKIKKCSLIFWFKYAEAKKYCKVWDHCQYTSESRRYAHSIYNLKYSIAKEIAIIFYTVLNLKMEFCEWQK